VSVLEAALPELLALRRRLHRDPEPSGREAGTARRVAEHLARLGPDALLTGLGGHGVAAVLEGAAPGPTVLLRADLDALPIHETGAREHRSRTDGVAHACGHDGHAATLAGAATLLAARRPPRGRVVLLFQPAEETGAGARAVVGDPRFAALAPDRCFALHNMPGVPLGRVLVRAGTMTCASRGVRIALAGRTAHAAHPDEGRSPGPAIARLIEALPRIAERVESVALVTVIHARLGEAAFGTAPGEGEVLATLRAEDDTSMERLAEIVTALAAAAAGEAGVGVEVGWHDVFRAGVNDADAAGRVERAASACGLEVERPPEPFRWSEDFAELTARWPGALFGLGAGEDCAPLHASDYDFPDALIPIGARLLARLAEAEAS